MLALAPASRAETGITNIVDGVISNYTGSFMLGSNGAFNELIVTNEGVLNVTNQSIIGNSSASSNNYAVVTGTGSVWSNSGSLYIGFSGSVNRLMITNGGSVVAAAGVLGYNAAATGNSAWVSGAGSSWSNSGELWIGRVGAGNLLAITEGGSVFGSSGTIGKYAGADNNAVLVSGAGSVWSNSGTLFVGRSGSGNQLAITEGGRVFNAGAMIGENSGNNAVLVSGSNSLWSNSGDLWIGAQGSGNRLTITNGATVRDSSGIIGVNAGAGSNTVVVSGVGSVWSNSAYLYVGHFGSGNQLTITEGATVFSGNGSIGGYTGANNNAVLVSGAGSLWKSSSLLVGQGGSGNRLMITDGGRVLDVYAAMVGYTATASNNAVFISGSASVWSNTGDIWVGRYGSGNQLAVTNGANALSANGYVGVYTGANYNVALVSGTGSVWRNSGSLFVGYSGAGNQLAVAGGGAAAATNIVIGVADTSTGNLITVSDGYLYATNAARTGTLDIRRGALALNSGTVAVDRFYATNGAASVVTFNGGTLQSGGSTIANGSVFQVGDGASSATLQLAGGSHSFANSLFINTNAWLAGTGAITGVITNAGAITIGDPLGILTGSSDLTLLDSSLLMMGLAGTNAWLYDQIILGGALNFGGTLTLSLLDGFNPIVGNRFDLFDFTSSAGFFISTNLPTLDSLLYWDLGALYTSGEIEVGQLPLVTISNVVATPVSSTNAIVSWNVNSHGYPLASNVVSYWLEGDTVTNTVLAAFDTNTCLAAAWLSTLASTNGTTNVYHFIALSDTGLDPQTYFGPSATSNGTFDALSPFRIINEPAVMATGPTSAVVEWYVANEIANCDYEDYWVSFWGSDPEHPGFEYGTRDPDTGLVRITLTLLEPGMTIFFNTTSWAYDSLSEYDYTITTPPADTPLQFTTSPPSITLTSTAMVSQITPTSAVVQWGVQRENPGAAYYKVYYWTGTFQEAFAESDPGNGIVTVTLDCLQPGQSYTFYAESGMTNDIADYVLDPPGVENYTFTTPASHIHIGTGLVSQVYATTACISWNVTNDVAQPATHTVNYVDDSTGILRSATATNDPGTGLVSVSLSGLSANSTYYFQIVSSLNANPSDAEFQPPTSSWSYYWPSFTTTNIHIAATTPTASQVTKTNAVISWSVSSDIPGAVSASSVSYAWSGRWGTGSGEVVAQTDASGNVTATLQNLFPGCTYTYQATSYLPDHPGNVIVVTGTFTTEPLPPISIYNVGTLFTNETSAIILWDAEKADPTQFAGHYVVYSPAGAPTPDNSIIAEGFEDDNGVVLALLDGLTPGSTNLFYVQSVLDSTPGHYATEDNLGAYYSFGTTAGTAPAAGSNTLAIVPGSVTNFVTDTEALITWEVVSTLPQFDSHFVVCGTNSVLTSTNSVMASGIEDDTGQVFALLTGLTPNTNYYYYVQSILTLTNLVYATETNSGALYLFKTLASPDTNVAANIANAANAARSSTNALQTATSQLAEGLMLAAAGAVTNAGQAWTGDFDPFADPDNDGARNFLEWFLGRNPRKGTETTVTFAYDNASRLTSLTAPDSQLSFDYDDANHLTSESQNIAGSTGAKTVTYGYDYDGNRSGTTYPDGTAVTYEYTGRNQLANVKVNTSQLCGYTYDAAGRPTAKALSYNGNVIATNSYSYYNDGQVHTIGSSVSSLTYAYDSQTGNRTSRAQSDAGSDSYTYDNTDQLTGVSYGAYSTNAAHSTSYSYDAVGNRSAATYNPSPATSGLASATYTANALNQYNRVGNGVLHYDANGNLVQQPGWVYTYDAQNRLIAASSATTLVEFAYDGRNRCVRRTTYSRSSGTPVVTDDVLLYYDGWSLIEERDASGNELARYIHGARVDEVLTMARGGTNYFYHADALGSVTHLTDSTGTNVVERYTYDVFGLPAILNPQSSNLVASAFGNRFMFTGREYLASLTLYDYRHRVYSATLGRFIQTDPLGFGAGDENLYRYVHNDSVNASDPEGLGPVYVSENCRGHEDLLANITYLAEVEPHPIFQPEPRKQYRRLPPPGQAVLADAVYFGDGTAWKVPDTTTGNINCVCEDGKWAVKCEKLDWWPFGRGKSSYWNRGDANPPPQWPDASKRPYVGKPPMAPLPPLVPFNPIPEVYPYL